MSLTADRIPQGWDDVSDAYDEAAFPVTSKYAHEAVRLAGVQDGDVVLDVAAGSGAATMAALDEGAEVVATDFAPRMIDRLRARLSDAGLTAESIVMDGQDLRFADSTFDKVISVFGLIFFSDRLKGMREMHRVLKPGGKACVVSWSGPELTFPISLWGKAFIEVMPDLPAPSDPPAVYSLADPTRFEQEMKGAGFTKVEITSFISTWDSSSPEEFWSTWHRASPVFTTLQNSLGDRLDLYRETVISNIRERFGSGEIHMEAEAHVGIGSKG